MTMTDTPAATNGSSPIDAEKAATDARIKAELARMVRISALREKGWKVELSGGQWATLSDPERLPERKARAIKVAMVRSTPSAPTDGGAIAMNPEAVIDSGYVMTAAFVSGWSLGDLPTVTNIEPLLELPSRDYARLQTACEDLKDEAFTDWSPSPEPTSPFVPPSG